MNFERHKKVLEATKIGIEANAPEVSSIWVNVDAGSQGIKDHAIPDFLQRLADNIFPGSFLASYHVSLLFPYPKDGSPWESVELNQLRGMRIKYKGKIYYIPNEL